MLKEYARFGCIGPNLKKEIGRKMTKAIESEPLDGFCLQSESSFCYSFLFVLTLFFSTISRTNKIIPTIKKITPKTTKTYPELKKIL